jgi:hypothetical protein
MGGPVRPTVRTCSRCRHRCRCSHYCSRCVGDERDFLELDRRAASFCRRLLRCGIDARQGPRYGARESRQFVEGRRSWSCCASACRHTSSLWLHSDCSRRSDRRISSANAIKVNRGKASRGAIKKRSREHTLRLRQASQATEMNPDSQNRSVGMEMTEKDRVRDLPVKWVNSSRATGFWTVSILLVADIWTARCCADMRGSKCVGALGKVLDFWKLLRWEGIE